MELTITQKKLFANYFYCIKINFLFFSSSYLLFNGKILSKNG